MLHGLCWGPATSASQPAMCSSDWLSRAQVLAIVCFCIHIFVSIHHHVRSCIALMLACASTRNADLAGAGGGSGLQAPFKALATELCLVSTAMATYPAPVGPAIERHTQAANVEHVPRDVLHSRLQTAALSHAPKAVLIHHVQHTSGRHQLVKPLLPAAPACFRAQPASEGLRNALCSHRAARAC
jgi:hypothetical protein